jgi:hypothetical protein
MWGRDKNKQIRRWLEHVGQVEGFPSVGRKYGMAFAHTYWHGTFNTPALVGYPTLAFSCRALQHDVES